jgi:hypothetical protein
MKTEQSALLANAKLRVIEVNPRSSFIHGLGPLFFEPLQLNLQPSDLLVDFRSVRFVRWARCGLRSSVLKDFLRTVKKLLLPKVDLSRVKLVLLSDLTNRFDFLDCLQGYFGLERSSE